MAQTYAQRFNDEISRFFDNHFPRKFKRYEPPCQNMVFAYYCNFPVIGVSKKNKSDAPYLIELTDTLIKGLWRNRLNERVSFLLEHRYANSQM